MGEKAFTVGVRDNDSIQHFGSAPDGEHVALSARDLYATWHADGVLYVLHARSGEVRYSLVLREALEGEWESPLQGRWNLGRGWWLTAWSPASRWLIVFFRKAWHFRIVSTKSWQQTSLVRTPAAIDSIAWSPDGCSIVIGVLKQGDMRKHGHVYIVHFAPDSCA